MMGDFLSTSEKTYIMIGITLETTRKYFLVAVASKRGLNNNLAGKFKIRE